MYELARVVRICSLRRDSVARASAARSRSVSSPTSGHNTCRTFSSGCASAALAILNSTVSLLLTRLNSCCWALSTRRSARVLIRLTRSVNRTTSESVISVSRHQHNTASSVNATSGE